MFESCMYIIELYLIKSYISCKLYLSYLYVCYMKNVMYSSMLCKLKVHNIVKEPVRANLPDTFTVLRHLYASCWLS